MDNLAQSPSTLHRSYQVERKFPARAMVPCDASRLFKVTGGVVRTLAYLDDGTPVVSGIWGADDVVGGMLSQVKPLYIECFTAVKGILLIPDSSVSITTLLRAYLQQVEMLTLIRSYKTIDVRLARLLSWLAHRFGEHKAQGQLIDLRLTHQDLAEFLGTTRVTMTRTLGQLEEKGLIQRLPLGRIILKESDLWFYEI